MEAETRVEIEGGRKEERTEGMRESEGGLGE